MRHTHQAAEGVAAEKALAALQQLWMLQAGLAFLGGYACHSTCSSLPCHARLATSSRSFKLSVVVHTATLQDIDGPGLIENQRPLVGVSVGDRTKETELGDWSKDKAHWCFQEVITVVVTESDEICLYVSSLTRYNLYVASVSSTCRRMGEICFPVAQILPRLRVEDRDTEGLVYATSLMCLDVVKDGRCAGKVQVSFETKSAPPSQKLDSADKCCGLSDLGTKRYRVEDDFATSEQLVPLSHGVLTRERDVWVPVRRA